MPTLPITLNFDLNDGCNLVCRMCGGRSKPSEQKYIPLHQFKERIIPLFHHLTAFQFGCQFEPLLVPYFNAAVRMIDQNTPPGTEGALVTNGTLLTEQVAGTLLETPVFKRIRISWDASHRDLFQSIRCGADFNRLLENLKRLIALKKNTGSSTSIEFNTTILPENVSDLPSILDLAGQLGVNRVTTNKLFPDDQLYVTESYAEILADNMARAAEVAKAHNIVFEGQTYRTFEKYQAINSQSFDDSSQAGRCSFHTSQRLELIMEPSGDLHSPCRRIQFPLCNVLNDDLAAMLEIGLIPLLETVFGSTDERCLGCHLLSVQNSKDEPAQLAARVQDPQPVEDCLQMQERNEPISNSMAAGQEPSQHEEQPTMAFTSELNHVIPPEIKDDEFYEIIQQLSRQADIKTVLEIGSSAGGGSTEAFVTGLRKNRNTTKLFCMEVSAPRFQQLKSRYQDDPFVHCYNVSSVPISCFPSERELELFYNFIPTALNNYPLEQVTGWLRQDIDYIRHTNVTENGIQLIKRENNIETFDMVLIDGSEFLGKAELEEVYGARIILLDDINGFKNYHNRQRLLGDPRYQLIHENFSLRNGYSVFRRKTDEILTIHFFTIVLNGEPFIRHHIDVFKQLPFRWHWHIVEGVADLVHDTAWSVSNGGRITDELHTNGLSNDGTSAYLDGLKSRFPDQVTIYRKPTGAFWNGKLEMVNAPLANIHEECLLWQVDCDELWNAAQINSMHTLFQKHPQKTSAQFICNFYVGPGLVISSIDTYGNHTHYEWFRCWRYSPGDSWLSHEPPGLFRTMQGQADRIDVGGINPFTHLETSGAGLVFDHFAYVSVKQAAFKQIYYGYTTAIESWTRLQHALHFPVFLSDYFPWVCDEAIVEQAPLLTIAKAHIICLRTDAIGDNVLSAGMLPFLKERYPGAILTVVCQDRVAPLYDACPFVDGVISFNYDRFMTQPVYRQLIIDKMNILQPTMILNPIYSHDLHDEFLAHHCQAPLKVACQGDASNRDQVKLDELSGLYSFLVPNDPADLTELDRHHTFLQGIGVNAPAIMPQVWTSAGDDAWADELLKQHGMAAGQAIILFPGSLMDRKTYPHYDKVLEHLRDYPLIVVGGEELREQGDRLCCAHGVPAINLAGQTSLGQMAALMRRGRLYLGSDSSGMHIACAVGLKNVVLLGGGHFGRFCPYSPLTTAVCLPLHCYHCDWQCRYKRAHCLHDIEQKTVIDAIRHALDDSKAREKPRLHIQQHSCHADTPAIFTGAELSSRLLLEHFSSNLV